MDAYKSESHRKYTRCKYVYGIYHPYTVLYKCCHRPLGAIVYLLFWPLKLISSGLKVLKIRKHRAKLLKPVVALAKESPNVTLGEGGAKALIKPMALYLPQYHTFPENDEWWGKGFTEWTNVKKAKPLFTNHYEPHVPHPDIGYYDLTDVNVMRKQAAMAKAHGVYGFCFYYYHFANGKRLLERPLNQWLAAKDIDLPFCFAWANENWTRAWDGGDKQVIMPQDYDEANMVAMLREMIPAFQDERYIKVDGKPLLLVYRPEIIPQIQALVEKWRALVCENGFNGLYLVSMQNFKEASPAEYGFDAAVEFAPQQKKFAMASMNGVPHKEVLECGVDMLHMKQVMRTMLWRKSVDYLRMKCVCPSWDNTPRRGARGRTVLGATPETFKTFFKEAALETLATKAPEGFLFINAWNEWGEGAHLEPDEKHGYAFLEAIRDVQNTPLKELV